MMKMKRILTVCAALLLALTAALPASAAAGLGVTFARATDGQEAIAIYPAVACDMKGNCVVITDSGINASGAVGFDVRLGDDYVEMTSLGELDEGLFAFGLDASYLSQPEVLDVAESIQVNEELVYYSLYRTSEGELAPLKCTAMVIEQDGSKQLKVSYPDSVSAEQILYPAIAVNRAGKLALVDGRQTILPLASIEGGGTNPEPTKAPDDPDPTKVPEDPDPEETSKGREDSDPTPAPTSEPQPGPGPSVELIVGIVAVAVAAAAVAGVVFFRKRGASGNTPNQPAPPPPTPVQPTAPVPDIPERIEPVEIKPQPEPRASVLYLCCEGGALDGRRYPVGTTTLLIGRDPSCNICYPADTKGVSRRHCEIFWKNGVLHIMDLGSTSGTFIRGKGQITANAPVAVNAGDTFYLGEKRNAFVIRMGE